MKSKETAKQIQTHMHTTFLSRVWITNWTPETVEMCAKSQKLGMWILFSLTNSLQSLWHEAVTSCTPCPRISSPPSFQSSYLRPGLSQTRLWNYSGFALWLLSAFFAPSIDASTGRRLASVREMNGFFWLKFLTVLLPLQQYFSRTVKRSVEFHT